MAVKTGDEARKAAVGQSSAYQQALPSNLANVNYWTGQGAEANPYIKLLEAGDEYTKSQYFEQIYRTLNSQASPQGGTMFDQLQTLLRQGKNPFSKGTTPIGIVDPRDIDGLIEATAGAIGNNAPDVISYLSTISQFGGRGAADVVKQPDTTTRYVRQVTAALQSLDEGDATKKYNDAFFLAYGVLPEENAIKEFRKAWNAEVKQQRADTTTRTKVINRAKVYDKKSEPVIDKKTGKQKIDKFGNLVYKNQMKDAEGKLVYEPITKQVSETPGLGFTAEEQSEFMADYLAANFPDIQDADNLGGAAKVIYDAVVKLDQDNYREVSNFAQVAPVIREVIASGNEAVATEYLKQYTDRIRKDSAQKYMAAAQNLAEGQNVADVAKPLMDEFSAMLETSIDIKDDLMVQALNYQGPNGEYRLPNEFERKQLVMKDSRFGKTSTAINNAVNTVQTLRSRLRG